MDKFQAAFEVLYILSAIDGEVDKNEIDVIVDFLESNENKLNFEIEEVINDLNLLNQDGILQEFNYASQIISENTSIKEKKILLDFTIKLIESDGEIDDNELILLGLLSEHLNIDLEQYLNS